MPLLLASPAAGLASMMTIPPYKVKFWQSMLRITSLDSGLGYLSLTTNQLWLPEPRPMRCASRSFNRHTLACLCTRACRRVRLAQIFRAVRGAVDRGFYEDDGQPSSIRYGNRPQRPGMDVAGAYSWSTHGGCRCGEFGRLGAGAGRG